MSDPWAAFGSESTPTPEPPAPAPLAEAEAPAAPSVETPTPAEPALAPPPAPAPESPAPVTAPPAPEPEFVEAAQKLQGYASQLQQQHQQVLQQEQVDYAATEREIARLDPESPDYIRAVQGYQQRRLGREGQVTRLQAGWAQLESTAHQVGTEYQRRQERTRMEPFAERVAYDLLADQQAAKFPDGAFDRAAFVAQLRAAQVPPNALPQVATLVAQNVRREAVAARQAAGTDQMGGAGSGRGGGRDYTKMSSSEMARQAAESFFAKR